MDLLIRSIPEVLTMNPEIGDGELGILREVSVGFEDGRLVYLGSDQGAQKARQVLDGRGCVALPGLVDCHTHALFAGSRADEFRRRLAGESYTAILEQGGGILSTVRATRAATDEELLGLLHARLTGFLHSGVTTVEVKSGYGLSLEQEVRLCRLLAESDWPIAVYTTFLGAHAIPMEWRSDRDQYVRCVIEEMIPAVADLADAVDVYCDRGAFTLDEARAILSAGLKAGLHGRIHAEQVEHTGSAKLAAEMGCLSADHLEQIDADGIAAMAKSGLVGVLLPGAQLYLKDPAPPVRALRDAGVPLAVATDFNPGSSPVRDLMTCATLACLQMGLTVEEAFLGITRHGARVLGADDRGWLGKDSAADLALFALPPGESSSAALIQYLGGHTLRAVVRGGQLAYSE